MSERRYQVRFNGKIKAGTDIATVKSNLVLETGLSEAKVEQLFARDDVLIKHCDTPAEAQRLVEKFDRAGAVCVIVDRFKRADKGQEGKDGSSALTSLLKGRGAKESANSSLFSRLVSSVGSRNRA